VFGSRKVCCVHGASAAGISEFDFLKFKDFSQKTRCRMPRSNCAVCLHAEHGVIDADLLAGQKLKTLAATYGISPFSLSRHKSRHLQVAGALDTAEDDSDSLEAQAQKWRLRADQLWARSEIDLDSRAAAQALAAGLRSCELQARQKERETENAPDVGAVPPITIQQLDAFVADAESRENPESKVIRAVTWVFKHNLTYNGSPVFLDLVEHMLKEVVADAELLTEFLSYKERRVAQGDRVDVEYEGRADDASLSQSHATN
jgi:hypothetical protein